MDNKKAFRLFHAGVMALKRASENGIRIDVDYCREQNAVIKEKMQQISDKIFSKKIGQHWRRKYGTATSLESPNQLSYILFDALGLESVKETKSGKRCVDKEAMMKVDHPLCREILKYKKLSKLRGTYFAQLLREVNEDGFMHPFFNLNTVRTFRSSSDNPNFQNLPIRDKLQGEYIRRAIIPRDSCRIVENDFKSLEVNISACYHKDPVMIDYLISGKDMHRDTAKHCYILDDEGINKENRWWGKSGFTFPAFYGSYYEQMAPAMWDAIEEDSLVYGKTAVSLYEHLKKKGINNQEEFTEHIRDVEDWFWNELFPVYRDWKKEWFRKYLKCGYFDMLTGFRVRGIHKKNDVTNYPIQGSAFHCLLWVFIELEKEIRRRKMKTLLIGQIHDSIVADVPDSELQEYLAVVKEIVEVRLREEWKWIIVPLTIEAEATETYENGGNWFEKKEIKI